MNEWLATIEQKRSHCKLTGDRFTPTIQYPKLSTCEKKQAQI
jgi:hypothetical protein